MGSRPGTRRGGRPVDAQHTTLALPIFAAQPHFEVWADFERTMPHSDPDARGLHLSCGAALLNLRASIVHEGWHPETRLLPDLSDRALLASVRLAGRTNDEGGLGVLHPAIRRRHSSRFPFEERQIPEAVRAALGAAARAEGAALTFPTSWHLWEVLELVQEAEARNITDPGSDQTWPGGRVSTPRP